MYSVNKCISSTFPENPKYFKEEVICEMLSIPIQKPDMKNVLDVVVWPEVVDISLIDTAKGKNFEGQYLTGAKLTIEINLKEKLTYVACEQTQSVHAVHYETLKSMFVILPEYLEGKKICDLIRANKLTVTPYVEDVCARILDTRTVHQCVMMFLDVKIC